MAENLELTTQLEFADYVRIARRRFAYWAAPFLALTVAVISMVQLLPPVYRSTGTVAIESQRIPEDLVRSTVRGSAEQRIGFIQQLVMTDTRLAELIHQFALYPDVVAQLDISVAVEKLRKNVTVEAVRDPYVSAATIAFTVSFDHTEVATAVPVATQIVDLFLQENSRTRNARASETAEFLRQEAGRLSSLARTLDHQVAEFKKSNSDALPEHLSMRVSMLQQVGFDIRSVQREIASTEQERRFLESQLKDALDSLGIDPGGAVGGLTPQQRLQNLKLDLATASATYTGDHPDVIRLKRMVAVAEAQLAGAKPDDETRSVRPLRNGRSRDVDAKIDAIEAELTSLREYERELSARMAELQAQILRTPQVEQGLRDLDFRYQRASSEYSEIRSKLQEAELAENLESEQLAERFILLEPPTVPHRPERPNRLKLIGLGIFAALAASVAFALAVELLDNRIQDAKTLGVQLGEAPFAILPYIEEAHERRSRAIITSGKWLAYTALLTLAVLVGSSHSAALADLLGRLYY